jgi:hypothetical protein
MLLSENGNIYVLREYFCVTVTVKWEIFKRYCLKTGNMCYCLETGNIYVLLSESKNYLFVAV